MYCRLGIFIVSFLALAIAAHFPVFEMSGLLPDGFSLCSIAQKNRRCLTVGIWMIVPPSLCILAYWTRGDPAPIRTSRLLTSVGRIVFISDPLRTISDPPEPGRLASGQGTPSQSFFRKRSL